MSGRVGASEGHDAKWARIVAVFTKDPELTPDALEERFGWRKDAIVTGLRARGFTIEASEGIYKLGSPKSRETERVRRERNRKSKRSEGSP